MAKKLYEETDIQNIANAIRSKNGSSDTYRASDMDNAISEIVTAAEAINDSTTSETTTWSSTKISSELEGKADVTALENKANIDGSYDDMTVGNAKQLVATVNTEDKIPYNFRTSGGSADIGDRLSDKLVGGTLAFNQLVQNGNFTDSTGWSNTNSTFEVNSGVGEFTATAQNGRIACASMRGKNLNGHAVLIVAQAKSDSAYHIRVNYGDNANFTKLKDFNIGTSFTNIGFVEKASTVASNGVYINFADTSSSNWQKIYIKNVIFIDLTQMFGSTIADYIYTLEQGTAGAGVAWVKELFPKAYYSYNAGELISVKTSAHNTIGFNAFNPTTNTAILLGGNQYQITGSYTSVSYQDINGDAETLTIDGNGKFTPSNNGTLTVVGGNSTDTCVHLVWDGERDGEFEEYVKHTYALDSDLELRGIAKLDSNNKLYYDGDTYESNGSVTRRYGIVTFDGSDDENWDIFVGTGVNQLFVTMSGVVSSASDIKTICNRFKSIKITDRQNNYDTCYTGATGICFNIQNYTVETWKAWLANNPITVIYELATPTTETADAFQDPQIVDDFGTEEYVDTRAVAIPVGHDTLYQPNLRAKLEMAPDSPSGNGDYIVRQNNGENTYVPLVIPTELPAAPTTDGTYTLNVTVSNGTATYTWVTVQ